jgi:hypothetical protein
MGSTEVPFKKLSVFWLGIEVGQDGTVLAFRDGTVPATCLFRRMDRFQFLVC